MRHLSVGFSIVMFTAPAFAQPAFQGLGFLPGGVGFSRANGVSTDGRFIAGETTSANTSGTNTEAAIWESSSGWRGLGDLPGDLFFSLAVAVSDDGRFACGRGRGSAGDQAFWYQQGVGMPPLVAASSASRGMDASGQLVAGRHGHPPSVRAWRSASGGPDQTLGDLPGGNNDSGPRAVSRNGSMIVGASSSSNSTSSGYEACYWPGSGSTVPTPLGDLPGGSFNSDAIGVNSTGTVIVGKGTSAGGEEAFLWSGGVMNGLGDLPGGAFSSWANAVSDSNIVVGTSVTAQGQTAFIWDSGNGMRQLADLLGTTVPAGWVLREAMGITPDARYIVGWGTNPLGQTEAFRADLGTSTACTTSFHESFESDAPGASASAWQIRFAGGGHQVVTSPVIEGNHALKMTGLPFSAIELKSTTTLTARHGIAHLSFKIRHSSESTAQAPDCSDVLVQYLGDMGSVSMGFQRDLTGGAQAPMRIVGVGDIVVPDRWYSFHGTLDFDRGTASWTIDGVHRVCVPMGAPTTDSTRINRLSLHTGCIDDGTSVAYFDELSFVAQPGCSAADYTTDGSLTVEDIFQFLAGYFSGCP